MPAEAANAERWSVECKRRDNCVYARAVRQPSVYDWLRFVNTAANLRDDLFDDMQQMRVIFEPHLRERELAVSFYVNLVKTIDENVGDRRLFEERLQRAQTQHLVQNLFDDPVLLRRRHRNALIVEQPLDNTPDLGTQAILGN